VPQEADYEFGKAAVNLGQMTQMQLEECIEVLVALERVGSQKRLWDVAARKGYVTAAEAAELRQRIAPSLSQDQAEKKAAAEESHEQETEEDVEIPAPEAGSFCLAHPAADGKVVIYPLPMRMVTIGSDSGCDITLSEHGVAERHMRVTCGYGKFRASLLMPNVRLTVNGRRMVACNLQPNDLLELGSALLVFLADYGDEPAPQPTTPAAVDGIPSVRLRIIEGPNRGTSFFAGSRPLVLGSHNLANVRLADDEVAEFHAHLAYTKKGIMLSDLKSRAGTTVNGLSVAHRILRDGDNITVGATTFAVKALTPSAMVIAAAADPSPTTGEEAPPEAKPEPAKPEEPAGADAEPAPQADVDLDWDVSLDVEVDIPSDPLIKAGIKPPKELARARPAPKAYAPGELQLTCVEGPLEGKSFVLTKPSTVIGRGRGVDILINNASTSRRHAEVVLGTRFAVLRDLGSRNGVSVNGTRISKKALRSGDTIRIGNCLLIAEEVLPASQA